MVEYAENGEYVVAISSFQVLKLTLGMHVQRGLWNLVCLCVCVPVCLPDTLFSDVAGKLIHQMKVRAAYM